MKHNFLSKQDEQQLKLEIEHIFESGANEMRIFEMVKLFINKRQESANYQGLPLFWVDAKKELPKQTKGTYSDVDVFICQLYRYNIGRTCNGKWVDMKNNPLEDVILWAYIPKIPTDMENLFE